MSAVVYCCGDVGPLVAPEVSLGSNVTDFLAAADIRFAQCERVYSNRGALHPTSHAKHSRCDPLLASIFNDCGFDVVSLAGNHVMDYGWDALEDTIALFEKMGIKTIGAGRNVQEARKPAIFNVKGQRIAFLGYGSILREGFEATDEQPGAAPLRVKTWYEAFDYQAGVPPLTRTEVLQQDLEAMTDDIHDAKEVADVVIVSMHWGVHYVPKLIAEYQPQAAKVAFAAGADAVIGHHAHTPKAIELFDEKPCFYSLSNFIMSGVPKTGDKARAFETNYGVTLDPDYPDLPYGSDAKRSLIAKLSFEPSQCPRASFFPVEIAPDLRPSVLQENSTKFKDALQFMNWVSEGRSGSLHPEGGEIIVRLDNED